MAATKILLLGIICALSLISVSWVLNVWLKRRFADSATIAIVIAALYAGWGEIFDLQRAAVVMCGCALAVTTLYFLGVPSYIRSQTRVCIELDRDNDNVICVGDELELSNGEVKVVTAIIDERTLEIRDAGLIGWLLYYLPGLAVFLTEDNG